MGFSWFIGSIQSFPITILVQSIQVFLSYDQIDQIKKGLLLYIYIDKDYYYFRCNDETLKLWDIRNFKRYVNKFEGKNNFFKNKKKNKKWAHFQNNRTFLL